MPKRARIHGCSKFQLAIIAAYLSLAAGGALLLSLTSLNDDIQGVAPKDMALLGAVIGAGAAVVFDNLVRWRFDEERVDAPNKYLLGAACVGLAALGAFGFPYAEGPADVVPSQYKAAAGTFLACLAYVVVDQIVRHRYNKTHDLAVEIRNEALIGPHRQRAEAAERKLEQLTAAQLAEARQREEAAVERSRKLEDALLASQDRHADAHDRGVQQAASLFAGAFTAASHLFGMGAQAGGVAPAPNEASRLLRLDTAGSRVTAAPSVVRRTGATAPLLLADAPRQESAAPASVPATSQRTSRASAVLAMLSGGVGSRAPTQTPPSEGVPLIR